LLYFHLIAWKRWEDELKSNFTNYPPFTDRNENQLYEQLFKGLGGRIPIAELRGINALLGPLRLKGPVYNFHWRHSVRVAFLTVEIAKTLNLDPKPALYAGLLHDCVKAQVPASLLGKTENWTVEDSLAIQIHVTDGYRLVAGWFDFSAAILLWHHRFQKNPYPEPMPPALHRYSEGTLATIEEYGRVLALADSYDALHRVNNTGRGVTRRTGEEIRGLMEAQNQDQPALVKALYEYGVLTTETE